MEPLLNLEIVLVILCPSVTCVNESSTQESFKDPVRKMSRIGNRQRDRLPAAAAAAAATASSTDFESPPLKTKWCRYPPQRTEKAAFEMPPSLISRKTVKSSDLIATNTFFRG